MSLTALHWNPIGKEIQQIQSIVGTLLIQPSVVAQSIDKIPIVNPKMYTFSLLQKRSAVTQDQLNVSESLTLEPVRQGDTANSIHCWYLTNDCANNVMQ